MLSRLRGLLASIVDLVLPPTCPSCGQAKTPCDPFCVGCAEQLLVEIARPFCPRCGASLGVGVQAGEDGCPHCPQPMPRFDRLVRLGGYDGPIRASVVNLKFRRDHRARRRLAELLAARVRMDPFFAGVDVVQPIPLHWLRQISRGYNQAEIIAASLARELDLPLGECLVRVRNTPPQVGLSRRGRVSNIRDAFQPRRTAALAGRHVLLVDDVTTTGATANEAARTLLAAGAGHVSLAVLAKADPPAAFTPIHENQLTA